MPHPLVPNASAAARTPRRWRVAALALLLPAAAWSAPPPATTLGGRAVPEAELRAWLQAARERHAIPGLAVATVEGGALRSVIALGTADVESGAPVTPDTRFEAASLSKPVFSRAWMVEVDAGRLSLDRPLAADGDDLGLGADPRVATLTPRQLLSHAAGLPNWRERDGGPVAFVGEPGGGLAYSGEGYDALARAMARTLRVDDAGLARHLAAATTPRGATARFGFLLEGCEAGKAALHRDGARLPWTPCLDHVSAAGGLEASPADYARWLVDAMAGRGLSAESDAAWWRGQGVTIPDDHPLRAHGLVDWSLGFAVHALPFGRTWVHTGDQPGYTALALVAEDRQRALVVMTNADGAQAFLLALVGFLAAPDAAVEP